MTREKDQQSEYKNLHKESLSFVHIIADINECESDPCNNGGTCNDEVNGYSCDCAPGYMDDTCQTGNNTFKCYTVIRSFVTYIWCCLIVKKITWTVYFEFPFCIWNIPKDLPNKY